MDQAPLEALLPYGGGLLALFVLLWAADKFTGGIVEELGKQLLGRFQSNRQQDVLKPKALRAYTAAVRQNYSSHTMGFRRDDAPIMVEKVYVPARYEVDGERLALEERLRDADRAVIVGEPGAGKSMLLKSLMLQWAKNPSGRSIPVLIDLHLYGTNRSNLTDLMVRSLSHGKWQFTPRQLESALADGRLRLYFDGLDEILQAHYNAALSDIKNLARQYHGCPIFVTCRDEVYDGELAAEFGPPIAVVDLDDETLRLLLRHLLESDQRVEALFRSLQENRPVLALARSPMLLTMIAYLYAEGVFGGRGELMPRSRWEFYEKAIAYLLRRDEARGLGEITRHGPAIKLAILRKVALLLMDRQASDDANDRRVITHLELLRVIRSEGDDFNLDPGEADGLIREIVERSRLLIRLEGKNDTYGFRHLTLQEYLVALELRADWHGLLRRYSRHPEVWHEVVRLWCGLSSDDSTPLLRRIYELGSGDGRLLTLRCLAEATRVDSAFAGEVIGHYASALESNAKLSEPTIRALGALGSSGGPRGDRLMNHLLWMASRDPSAVSRNFMARRQMFRVLAATGRADAVDTLISLTPTESAARTELRSMGELAIPALARAARDGSVWAINDIGRIGTPAAAEALVPLLDTPESTCVPAAWWLAALLNSDDVLTTLNKGKEVIPGDRIDWITDPFHKEISPRLRSIISRTAWLIRENLDKGVPNTLPPLSPLIVLPLHIELQPELGTRLFTLDVELKELARKIAAEDPAFPSLPHLTASTSDVYWLIHNIGLAARTGAVESGTARLVDRLIGEVLRRAFGESPDPATLDRYDRLLSTLDFPVKLGLVATLGHRPFRRDDWVQLAQPTPEPLLLGMLTRAVWICVGLVLAISGGVQLINTIRGVDVWGPSWLAIMAAIAVTTAVISLPVALAMDPDSIESATAYSTFAISAILGGAALIVNGFAAAQGFLHPYVGAYNWMAIIGVLIFAVWLATIYTRRLLRFANPCHNLLHEYAPHLLPA